MKHIVALTAVAALLAGCGKANVEQASEQFNELPAAVRETTREHLPNAEIASVAKHDRNGVTVYEIRFRDADRHPPLEVAADGTIVKYERPVAGGARLDDDDRVVRGSGGSDLSALPMAVQRAIKANTPPADVAGIQRSEQNGVMVYDIEFAGHDRKSRLRVTQDGKVVPHTEERDND